MRASPNVKTWQIGLFLLCQVGFGIWAIQWSRDCHLPPPGYAVALIGVVAAVMSIQGEMKGWQKAIWMLIIAVLLRVEFKAIKDDRTDNDKKQQAFFTAQKLGFQGITHQASQNFSNTAAGLTTAIDGLKSVLGTTKKVVENVTGGDSYAPQGAGAVIPLSIHNYGGNILSGVSVQIRNLEENWWDEQPSPVAIGTLAPYGFAPIPTSITPVPNKTGVASYWIFIDAQNGRVDEMLQFRKSKTHPGFFAYRLTVKRDISFDALGKPVYGPKSVEPLESFGWSDEREPK